MIQWSNLSSWEQQIPEGNYFAFKLKDYIKKKSNNFFLTTSANLSDKKLQTCVILTLHEKLIYIALNSQSICKL